MYPVMIAAISGALIKSLSGEELIFDAGQREGEPSSAEFTRPAATARRPCCETIERDLDIIA
jgi:hypothetical protein